MSRTTKGIDIPETLQHARGAKAADVQLTPPSLLARNTVLNFLGEGWTFVVLLIAMPKLLEFIGETAFGLFSLAWIAINYLTFLDIGVSRAATKFVSEHLAENDAPRVSKVVRAAIITNLILGIGGGLAILLTCPFLMHVFKVAPNLQRQAHLTFYFVGVAVPVLLAQGICRAVLSSYQRFGWINAINTIAVTAQWGLGVLLAWRGLGVAFVVGVTVLIRLIAMAAYGLLVWDLLPPATAADQKVGIATTFQLLRFGGWVSISQLISPLLVYLDRLLIASSVSLSAVALYTVPYEAMTRLRVIPSNLMSTLFPAFSERSLSGQEGHLQDLYVRSLRYLLLLLLPATVLLVVLGSDVLTVWMGAAFARQTTFVLELLAIGALANGLAYLPYNLLQAVGRPNLTAKFHLLELPFYVASCVVLIPRWGIAGAAAASTLRFVLDAGLLFWGARKYGKCSLGELGISELARICALSFALGIALLALHWMLPQPWLRIAASAFGLLLYSAASWILLIDKHDKPALTAALIMKLLRSQPAA